ncbi:MAG TPA: carbon monoxide dehydrogenase subunit G [Acidocella sp.]|jgi:carbon monoxide dehydrogenase subunit G|nr:carbon monoxide dehydrogenase subunit G [Acidocella sp.]
MNIDGEYRIPAPPQRVWDGLNDPAVLQASLPGCKALEQTGANEFTATVTAKIGPVAATFKGKVELSELDPPHGYTLSGRGQGGPAGFAKGSAQVRLTPDGDGTILRYSASVEIGGKLASVGSRLIGGVATKLAGEFFESFGRTITGGAVPAQAAPTAPAVARPVSVAPVPASVPVPAGGYLPLLDRCAWLVAGVGIGIVATLALLGRF